MKKILAMLLALVMVLSLAACGGSGAAAADEGGYKVAMITDYGDITDQSFNQTTYEACKAFAEANNVPFTYFKPAGDSDAERVAMIEKAIDEGYNVIVMPGYAFAGSVYAMQDVYPDVKFIALDVSEYDVHSCFYNKDENGNWTTLIDENNPAHISANVYCAVYQEELCGYMAGYAAVKLGYTKLGFLGGMAVPAVQRYGYGFVQGADAAAKELNITVDMNYIYGGLFYGTADITAVMDTWYQGGTEIVFACGGGIFTSAVDAAKKVEGTKVIGVDVDQAGVIAAYAGDADTSLTITSAMKGLYPTTVDTLTDVIINGNWEKYSGKVTTLGLVSGDDPEANYVQIPMESTQWSDSFTKDDYKALVKGMFDGTIIVSGDVSVEPTVTNVNVDYQGQIVG
ncbi:MAG: BMP family ABC transporter substrate-binding protein [Oscillospiraceae bacterium]|nr:BMP family ABC transporter substrate-binding protein [Oscillospiraceae bacterium]